ncbi:MAG TPA: rhodanese-like domain-containing protein [Candidatus Polarisedimenticolaceae bacterium]
MSSYDDRNGGGVFFGAVAIVALGALLGLGQNVMVRRGEDALHKKDFQRRSLSWIKTEAPLPVLEASADGGSAPAPVPPVVSDSPFRMAEPNAADLPAVPDLAQPIQMQLGAVKKFFDAGAAVFIDARPKEEYDGGHIPGAVNLPYDEAAFDPERLSKFDAQGKPIIVYCGGGTCELSMNLAWAMLQSGQKKLLVFVGGTPEWEGAGYPLNRTTEAK